MEMVYEHGALWGIIATFAIVVMACLFMLGSR